ncbi:MAG: NAD-dependent DNA ligase LigA [Mycoplasmataceae bacterium]|nr:NAD-dependent DNA ligase LigA [Mycoplasmataceae bacterium]
MKHVQIKIEDLKKQLQQWAHEYYDLDKPTVSDAEYDLTLQELITLETTYPQFATDDSPTKKIGGSVATHFVKVRHDIPMLSLSNQFSEADLRKFDQDIKKEIGTLSISYNVEPKIDGLSISLIYINGVLKQALTRGDGEFGEDVTNNVRTIKTVPLRINTDITRLEIRGEIFLSYKEFHKINATIDDEAQKFANPRNAAAGSLRNLDSSISAKRNLDMIAYYIPDESVLRQLGIYTQANVINLLKQWGFKTANEIKLCENIDKVITYITEITQRRPTLAYPIDGIVIKENEIKYYDILGHTAKFPKWATAFKFPPEIAQTKLLNITPTVGRTGRITYVANLQPVHLDGSTVTAATLHNAEYIKDNDIRINDTVQIFKAAEIIPKVMGPVLTKRPEGAMSFTSITHCPICNTLLEKQIAEVDQYCTNVSCPARIVQSMIHFTSKKAMNIEDLSEKNLQKLYDANIIRCIQDIYKFKDQKSLILQADFKIKEKMFNNLVNNINASKNNSLEKLIFAIGIRHVGETTAKILAKTFRSIDNIAKASLAELTNINDIGEVVAISIMDFFKNTSNQTLIQDLKSLGVNTTYIPTIDESKVQTDSIYYQKTFVITGSFDVPRHEIKKKLEQKFDANVVDAVSKSTDYLIVGANGGSKKTKADKLNIPIIQVKIWE